MIFYVFLFWSEPDVSLHETVRVENKTWKVEFVLELQGLYL